MLLEVGTLVMRAAEFCIILLAAFALIELIGDTVPPDARPQYVRASVLGAFLFAILAEILGAYDVDARFSLRIGWYRLLTAWMACSVALLTIAFFLKMSGDFSRLWFAEWMVVSGIVLCVERMIGTTWLRRLKRRGVFNQRIAIYGAGPQGDRLANHLLSHEDLTIDVVGFFDERSAARLPERRTAVPLRGDLDDLIASIQIGDIDQVMIALPLSDDQRLQQIVGRLAICAVRLRLAPDLAGFAFAQRPVTMLAGLPVLTVFDRPISGFDSVVKKFEDLAFGLVLLVLTSPIMLAVALAIRLESPGPILFVQEREGFNSRRFHMYKFRSMYVEQSEHADIRQVVRGDPRVTRVGKWLRRLSLDELPQLLNVVRGEMSLVGPRPHAPSTKVGNQLFSDVVTSYAARHKVKPGITGWAQVKGWRGQTDTEEKLRNRLEHDLYYIENWSFHFDLYIMAMTGGTVLFSKAAF